MPQRSSGSFKLSQWLPHLVITLVLISVTFLLFWAGMEGWSKPTQGKSWELTLQFLLQFLAVAVLGGAVTLHFRDIEDRRAAVLKEQEDRRAAALKEQEDRRAAALKEQEKARARMEAQQAALEEFRKALIETYHSTKKVRRTLRASSFPMGDGKYYCCERERFERLMDQLEEMQLQTEALKAEVEARHDLFGTEEEKKRLRALLKGADQYLRELLRQYEDQYAERRELKATDLLRLSDKLTAFIGRLKGDNAVHRGYFNPITDARRIIVKLIEENTLPSDASKSSPLLQTKIETPSDQPAAA